MSVEQVQPEVIEEQEQEQEDLIALEQQYSNEVRRDHEDEAKSVSELAQQQLEALCNEGLELKNATHYEVVIGANGTVKEVLVDGVRGSVEGFDDPANPFRELLTSKMQLYSDSKSATIIEADVSGVSGERLVTFSLLQFETAKNNVELDDADPVETNDLELLIGDDQLPDLEENRGTEKGISWIDRLFAERVTTEKVVQRLDVSDAAAPTFEKITDLFPDTVTIFAATPEQKAPHDALHTIVQSPIGTKVIILGETFVGPERVPRDAMVFSREEDGVAITYVEARQTVRPAFEQRFIAEGATSTSSTPAENMPSPPKEPVTILTISPELERRSIAEPGAMAVDVRQSEVGAVQFSEEVTPLSPVPRREQITHLVVSPDAPLPQPELISEQFLVEQTPRVPTMPDSSPVTVEQNSTADTFVQREASSPVQVSPEPSSPDVILSQSDQEKESLSSPAESQVAPGDTTASLTSPVSQEQTVLETVPPARIEHTNLVALTDYRDIAPEKITPQYVITEERVVTQTDRLEQSVAIQSVAVKTETVIENAVVDVAPDHRAITSENSVAEKNEVSHEPEAKLLVSERIAETVEAEPSVAAREIIAKSSEVARKEEDLKIAFQGVADVVSPIVRPRRTIRITEELVNELFGQDVEDNSQLVRLAELRRQAAATALADDTVRAQVAAQTVAALTA